MAKFRAKSTAFYGNRRIRPGEVFDAPKDFKSLWADPVAEEKAKPEKKAEPEVAKKAPVRKKTAKKKTS